MTVRRGRAALAEEGAAGVAGVLGWCSSTPRTPVEVAEGSRGREVHRRQEISVAVVLPVAVLRGIIRAEERAKVAGEGLRSSGVVRRC
jgi:hypothetical protein